MNINRDTPGEWKEVTNWVRSKSGMMVAETTYFYVPPDPFVLIDLKDEPDIKEDNDVRQRSKPTGLEGNQESTSS